mgnify:CR=1 FL=1
MNEKSGWVKLHRKMLDNPIIMKDADHLAVWMYLLLNATHAEYPALFRGKKITLQPGQLITGRKSIAGTLCVNESKVTRILSAFEIEQQIEQQASNKNRLITVVNWDKYQLCEQPIEQQMNNKRTSTEQQVNTNKKNKNVKNEKNEINYSDIPELNEAILEFIKFRKSVKKPMTDNAVKLMLGKLNKMTSNVAEQIEIINQSILGGWTGIYPLKNQSGRKEIVPKWATKEQNNYDFDELEKALTDNAPKTINNDPELMARVEALKTQIGD